MMLTFSNSLVSGGPNSAGMGSAAAGLLKRDSCSTLPLNINLLSAKNQQKAAVTSIPIKQQLPMKLAKLASSTGGPSASGNPTAGASSSSGISSVSTTSVSSPTSGGLVQQLLPLRLSESLEHKRASPKMSAESFKPKLSSSSFSPPASKNEDFVVGHNRTGSSPASIQMLSPRHHAAAAQPPKVPDKPALLLQQAARGGSPQLVHPHQQQAPQPPPRVHDPETNQEIVFL